MICVSFASNATSLCGDGLKYVFNDKSNAFVLYNSNGNMIGKGTYLFDNKGDIRFTFEGSMEISKFVRKGDAFYFGDSRYTICD